MCVRFSPHWAECTDRTGTPRVCTSGAFLFCTGSCRWCDNIAPWRWSTLVSETATRRHGKLIHSFVHSVIYLDIYLYFTGYKWRWQTTHPHLIYDEQALLQGALAPVGDFVAHVAAPQMESFNLAEEGEGRDALESLMVKVFLLPALQWSEGQAIITVVCHAIFADRVIVWLVQLCIWYDSVRTKSLVGLKC